MRWFVRSRIPAAVFAGLLLAAAFPNIGIAGMAWIAPGLILAITLGKSPGESFRIGYFAGLTHYLASLYWLLLIPVRGFPILGWFALSAFLALYPATWTWLAARLAGPQRQTEKAELQTEPALNPLREASRWSWGRRTRWALSCAALWVAMEMIIARFLGGFPWNLLGTSQYKILPLIQFASITGVYGISFLVVWCSVSVLSAVAVIAGYPNQRSYWMRELLLPLGVLGVILLFGFHQLSRPTTPAPVLNATLVQPSVPQTLIWNQGNDLARFQELLAESDRGLTNATDVLIWPEAAVPGMPRYDPEIGYAIQAFAREHKVWMIIGADDGEATPIATNYYNASFLVGPDGRFLESYRKRSLVIFGEYIPLERWLPIVKMLTPVTGSYTPGDHAVQFKMDFGAATSASSINVNASPLICFEDNFPHLVRRCVESDTDFLVNLTNNGWFGEGAAQWQHAANAIFRAIENGLPLVRCTNNGLTCWVDANGRIREFFRDGRGSIYGKGFMTVQIPLRDSTDRRPTIYNRYGDWFGWSCVGVSVLVVLVRKLRGA